EGQAREVCPPARRGNREAPRRGPAESFHRAHVRREQSFVAGESRDLRDSARAFCEERPRARNRTGAAGGEEDDVVGDHAAKLYTTPEDTLEVARRLNPIGGRYLLAATFGNVHSVYKPGHVKLRPKVLKECQDAVVTEYG